MLATLQSQIDAVQAGGAGSDSLSESLVEPVSGCRSDLTAETSDEQGRGTRKGKNAAKAPVDAFTRIVRLCSSCYRSKASLSARLLREGYEQHEIDTALTRAQDCLLVDDLRFADVLIRSRIRKGKGAPGIEAELLREGVDPVSVPGWPEDYLDIGFNAELDRAVAVLQAKPPHAKNVRAAGYRKLVQSGYSTSVSSAASRLFEESQR